MSEPAPLSRWLFFRAVFVRPWVAVAVAIYTWLSFGDFLAEKTMSPEGFAMYQRVSVAPDWSTTTWLIVGMLLSLAIMFEGSYRLVWAREVGFRGAIKDSRDQFTELKGTIERRDHVREVLGSLIAEGKFYENKCLEKRDDGLSMQYDEWEAKSAMFISKTLNDQGLAHLFFMATEVDYIPDPIEMRRHEMVRDQFMLWLQKLRSKRQVLEAALKDRPPLRP